MRGMGGRGGILGFALVVAAWMVGRVDAASPFPAATERRLTRGPGGRVLTNIGVWSPDSRWIVYDTRSDAAGEVFDGTRIEAVRVDTGEVRELYQTRHGAHCGVATFDPTGWRVVFIHGPESPSPEWSYGAARRQGTVVEWERPGLAIPLDARDLVPPFTQGALRGGSHVHVFSPDGRWVSFTYEDHVLASAAPGAGADLNQRNVGVSIVGHPVAVPRTHPRNHDGSAFTVLVTRTENHPTPGSDEILKAYEEGWVGTDGYRRSDGSRQRALAFLGNVVAPGGSVHAEVYLVDLPDDLTTEGGGPLAGTATRRPSPPRGVTQRRLTRTADRRHPGMQGPRHWLRASPDGSQIACLMKDDAGVVQIWTVAPDGSCLRQVTRNAADVASAFSWSPDGRWIAHAMDGSVCVTEAETGATHRLTPPGEPAWAPRPEACVFAPDGRGIAFVRRGREAAGDTVANQIHVIRW